MRRYINGFLNGVARSKAYDLLGVGIILIISYYSGFFSENLGMITHSSYMAWIPFGIISILSAILSMYSDRLTCRLNNVGNWIGLITVILSGLVDYTLGNKAAILTYPLTFIIQAYAIDKWVKSTKYRAEKPMTGWKVWVTVIASFILSFGINYIGFWTINPMYILVSIIFGLSLTANLFNAFKVQNQWYFWVVYNLVQLVKSAVQGNFANLGKYAYYILNSIAGISYWVKSRE